MSGTVVDPTHPCAERAQSARPVRVPGRRATWRCAICQSSRRGEEAYERLALSRLTPCVRRDDGRAPMALRMPCRQTGRGTMVSSWVVWSAGRRNAPSRPTPTSFAGCLIRASAAKGNKTYRVACPPPESATERIMRLGRGPDRPTSTPNTRSGASAGNFLENAESAPRRARR